MNKLNYQFTEHNKEEKSLTVNKSTDILTLLVRTLVNDLPSSPTNKVNQHIATLQATGTWYSICCTRIKKGCHPDSCGKMESKQASKDVGQVESVDRN